MREGDALAGKIQPHNKLKTMSRKAEPKVVSLVVNLIQADQET
jgi:hypothetical protein